MMILGVVIFSIIIIAILLLGFFESGAQYRILHVRLENGLAKAVVHNRITFRKMLAVKYYNCWVTAEGEVSYELQTRLDAALMFAVLEDYEKQHKCDEEKDKEQIKEQVKTEIIAETVL